MNVSLFLVPPDPNVVQINGPSAALATLHSHLLQRATSLCLTILEHTPPCHVATYMRQRGMTKDNVGFILAYGPQVDNETWLLRKRDVAHEIERRTAAVGARKPDIQTLECLNPTTLCGTCRNL